MTWQHVSKPLSEVIAKAAQAYVAAEAKREQERKKAVKK